MSCWASAPFELATSSASNRAEDTLGMAGVGDEYVAAATCSTEG